MLRRCDERVPTQREGGPIRRRPRKGLYLLPSMFTAGNMAAGYLRHLAGHPGNRDRLLALRSGGQGDRFAIVFDFFDGGIARLTNTASDFGRELDSLADVITFGVAPAVLAWMWGFRMLPAEASHGVAHARHSDRRGDDLRLSAGGSVAAGALQYRRSTRSRRIRAALVASILSACRFPQAPAPLPRWFTWCRGTLCRCGGFRRMGRFYRRYFVFDGQHVALLQLEGNQLPPAAEFSLADRHGRSSSP